MMRRIDKVRLRIMIDNPSKYLTPEELAAWGIIKIIAPLLASMKRVLERDKI